MKFMRNDVVMFFDLLWRIWDANARRVYDSSKGFMSRLRCVLGIECRSSFYPCF